MKPGEFPPCARYPERRHRFDRLGVPITLLDENQTEHGEGLAYRCECGAALVEAPHIGPGYQLAQPLDQPGFFGPS